MKDRFPCDDVHKPNKTLIETMNKKYEELFGKLCDCELYEAFCRCNKKTNEKTYKDIS